MTVPISVNTSNYTSEPTNQMKNGYFLAVLSSFKDAKTKKESVSLPYIGFKGNYHIYQELKTHSCLLSLGMKPSTYANEK